MATSIFTILTASEEISDYGWMVGKPSLIPVTEELLVIRPVGLDREVYKSILASGQKTVLAVSRGATQQPLWGGMKTQVA